MCPCGRLAARGRTRCWACLSRQRRAEMTEAQREAERLRAAERRAANLAAGLTADGEQRSARLDPVVDPVAVALAVAGEQLSLSVAERRTVVAILTAHGHTAQQVADRVGCTAKTVERDRAILKETTA